MLLALLCTAPVLAAEAPRLALARKAHGAQARALIERAGLKYPPGALLLRVFKGEDKIEVWAGPAQGKPMLKVQEYKVCARSGGPGPKRKSGDLQVPEGFYRISTLNPASSYHLSMQIDYPNQADRARGQKASVKSLGGDIFIHGECVTIGCLPITNGPIEELFVLAVDTKAKGTPIDVHLFPRAPRQRCVEGAARARHRPGAGDVLAVAWGAVRGVREEPRGPEDGGEGRWELPARAVRRAIT